MFGLLHMPNAAQFDEDFNEFWQQFPRRVGKIAARKAYEKARQSGVTQAELLAGVERYIRTKPAYADWCHPRTWLSQGRWMDEVATPVARGRVGGALCPHVPRCLSTKECIDRTLGRIG